MFLVNWARKAVSNGRNTTVHKGELLDISVMQPERCRLLAMSYPCEGVYTIWRNDVYVVRNFLTERYGSDWRVFNLTETQYDPHLFYGAVTHLPIPDHHAPPLMKLLDYVQVILQYLEEKPTNVAVIHCLAGKGRTGTMIACLLVAQGYAATDALSIFAMSRGQAVTQGSQIRYVKYFEKLLLQDDRRAPAPIMRLVRIQLSHAPRFEGDDKGSWPRMALECGGRELAVMATPHRVYADNLVTFDLDVELQGDVLFRMMHMQVPLFRVQFHTMFLEMHDGVAEFALAELDEQDEQPDIFERRFNPAARLRFFFREAK